MAEAITTSDIICIMVYFVLVMAVGLWSTFRTNRNSSTTGYFLAGKQMHWFPVGASIFSSNIGARMFIGLAGAGASSGFAVTIYEWHAIFLLILTGWLFLPVYSACGAYTMPDYMKRRFGGSRLRIMLALTSLFFYIASRLSSEIFSGSIFMQEILGWNLYASIGGILFIAAVFTAAGGLTAVIYTDTIQTVILIVGASSIFFITLLDVGGWNGLMERYPKAIANLTLMDPVNRSCGLPRKDFMHIWRDPVKGDIPWTGAVFGLTTLGITVWCTDQFIVQRCLAAKSLSHAKAGVLLAGILKILPFFLFIIPGMISRIMFPNEIACSDPESCQDACGNEAGCTNLAYPLLVVRKLPTGVKGMMLAALLAALMSTLTSIFNSSSTMITMDIWRRFRRKASQRELMVVGRVCVIIMVVISILWIPLLKRLEGGELWAYALALGSCTGPPWCWCFLLAVFWKGTTEAGAFWGVIISTVTGFIRMVLQMTYTAPLCGTHDKDTRPNVLKDVHFLHFAIILSAVSIVSTVSISLFTKKRTPAQLRRVTWWTRHDPLEPEEVDSDIESDDESPDINKSPAEVAVKDDQPLQTVTVRTRVQALLCGTDYRPMPKVSKEERAVIRSRMMDIEEKPVAKMILNWVAIISVVLMTYLLGYFH